jgi:hypothetical protein
MSDSHAKRDWRVFEMLYLGLLKHFSGMFGKQSEYKVTVAIKSERTAALSCFSGEEQIRTDLI